SSWLASEVAFATTRCGTRDERPKCESSWRSTNANRRVPSAAREKPKLRDEFWCLPPGDSNRDSRLRYAKNTANDLASRAVTGKCTKPKPGRQAAVATCGCCWWAWPCCCEMFGCGSIAA